ncbi:MAG TPA: BACON domain-containing protein [Vicinamibacterales bacterium]|nr:BACON domain-containing protein [Vicinamibacterales bacterium]
MRKIICLIAICASISAAACSEKRTPTSPTAPTPACTYTLSSTSLSVAGTGGTASIAVTAGTGCAWTASSNAGFVSITSGATQTGNGTVNVTVSENTGDARTATLTIAGQAVTVSQAAGDALYGNWAGTIVKGAGCPATLPASVTWTGTIRRTSAASSEFVITIASVGVVNQAIPLFVNGNSLQFFVPIDTLYTFNATLANDRRSLTGTFSGGTCNGTWSGARQ